MAIDDRFKQIVIATLAKRAANCCSNPDCGVITSGPSADPSSATNIGEAAHIYGANPGAARYDPGMTYIDRSAISNGIWLCGNCHKMVDDDPIKFPAGLLFEWQREHEELIRSQIGKAGFEIRRRYQLRHLEELGQLSYLAERIVIEKDGSWEYRLTAEVLRYEMAPVLQRWKALREGIYVKPLNRIKSSDTLHWIVDRNHEVTNISGAFSALVNNEFKRAWGDPGVPGSDVEIIATARLYAEMCKSALAWEESVRFVSVANAFEEVKSLLIGIAGGIIQEASKLPEFLSETLSNPGLSGEQRLAMVLDLPEGWSNSMDDALERLKIRLNNDED